MLKLCVILFHFLVLLLSDTHAQFFTNFNTSLSPKPIVLQYDIPVVYVSKAPSLHSTQFIFATSKTLSYCSFIKSYPNLIFNCSITQNISSSAIQNMKQIYCYHCIDESRTIDDLLTFHEGLRSGLLGNMTPPDFSQCGGIETGIPFFLRGEYCFCWRTRLPMRNCNANFLNFTFFFLNIFPPIGLAFSILVLLVHVFAAVLPDIKDVILLVKKKWNTSKLEALLVVIRFKTTINTALLLGIVLQVISMVLLTIASYLPVFEYYGALSFISANFLLLAYGFTLIFWMTVIDSTNEGTKATLSCKHMLVKTTNLK